MKKRLFPLIITLSALSVAGSAAFYSVFGLSKLFAGASTQVIIMAGSLEFAKLVVASLLYQYWNTINRFLRSYLMIAVFVLMVITSGGIYGFLSGAYQSTATQSELLDKSLAILNQKQIRFEETKEDLTLEKTQINKSISDLRVSLSNPHSVSWYDKNSETVITSSSGSARRALQAELKTTIIDRDNINLKLESVLDSIGKTDMALLNKEISNENERELGPLKYLAKTTGWPMDKVVNYFLLLIVFVFDPLAIALVVAANFAFTQIRPRRKEKEKEPTKKERYNKREDLDDEYFDDLKHYIEAGKEEDIENIKYPKFVETHYPSSKPEINIYGDDEWATPPPTDNKITSEDDENIEGTTIELEKPKPTVRIIKSEKDLTEKEQQQLTDYIATHPDTDESPYIPTSDDLEKLERILSITENKEKKNQENDKLYYGENSAEEEIIDTEDEDYFGDLYRLTDTTQTLIVDKEVKKEEKDVLRYKGR